MSAARRNLKEADAINSDSTNRNRKADGADDAKTKDNKALQEAASKGDVVTVLALIKKGADPQWRDSADNGKTALVKSSILLGKLDVVKVLLENGADINYPDGSNRYPVYFCHPYRDKAKALRLSLKAVLCAPHFLFLQEMPGQLDDHALAAWLSYFLWKSMPDRDIHWFKAESETAFIFNIHVGNYNRENKRSASRVYVDPEGEKVDGGLIVAKKITSAECHKKYG